MPYGMNLFLWTADATGDRWLPLFERLKKMGFDSVEVPVMAPDEKKFAKLGRDLENLGLRRTAATALFPHNNLVDPDPTRRRAGQDFLKAALDSCQAMGSPLLIGCIYAALGVFTGKGPTREEWAWAVEGLRAAAEHGEKAGVTLGAEFLNRFEIYLINCVRDTVRLVKDVDHPRFRMMYDTFHAHIEEKDPARAIAEAAEFLIHVHVSESDRSTPGSGQVRWKETFDALRRIGYRGSLTIEAFGQGLPELAAATKIWRRMFESEEQLARDGLRFMKAQWEEVR